MRTILDAFLIVTMILSFSMMGYVDASQDDENQRIETKKQDIKEIEKQFEELMITIFEMEAELHDLESKGGDVTKQEEVRENLDALYDQQEVLQERSYELFEIPEKRHEKLLEVKQKIIDEYERIGILGDVFIDHGNESIQLILDLDYLQTHESEIRNKISRILTSSTTGSDIGDIEIGLLHFTLSSGNLTETIERYPPPAIQIKLFNTAPSDVQCNKELELYKRNNIQPLCLKPQTYEKLLERGLDLSRYDNDT